MPALPSHPLITLGVIISLGLLLGSIRLGGVRFGPASVLFVALVFGNFGATVPQDLADLGLVLFVYSIGLAAGPRFLHLIRIRGWALVLLGVGVPAIGAVLALAASYLLGLPAPLVAGLFAAAGTCTPALAAALDAARVLHPDEVNLVSVGYGIAYPFATLAIVLCAQALPRLMGISLKAAEERSALEDPPLPPLSVRTFRVENPPSVGKSIAVLSRLGLLPAKISRLRRDGELQMVTGDVLLQAGDMVQVVGAADSMRQTALTLGTPILERLDDPEGQVMSEDIRVSHPGVFDKRLREVVNEVPGHIVVTRVRRDGLELSPSGSTRLEPADILRIVGRTEDIAAFSAAVGHQEHRLEETTLLPFMLGIGMGALVGLLPIPLPDGLRTSLGLAGGTFLVALVLGHFGRIGPFRLYVPNAALYLARELGLVLFLSAAGTSAGAQIVPVLQERGPALAIVGAVMALAMLVACVLLLRFVLRWNLFAAAGALTGAMSNPSALGSVGHWTDRDALQVLFGSVYPVGLVSKIVLAQVVVLLGR